MLCGLWSGFAFGIAGAIWSPPRMGRPVVHFAHPRLPPSLVFVLVFRLFWGWGRLQLFEVGTGVPGTHPRPPLCFCIVLSLKFLERCVVLEVF